MRMTKKDGFTLIELLVTLSIVGLLTSIVLTSVTEARARGRDALRKSQTAELQRALALYFSTNEKYPCGSSACSISVVPITADTIATGAMADSVPGKALTDGGFISSIPNDPLYPRGTPNTTTSCNSKYTGAAGYCYCSNGSTVDPSYVLTVNTENDEGGSDRCYILVGPSASTFCTGHQFPGGSSATYSATQDCSERFQ